VLGKVDGEQTFILFCKLKRGKKLTNDFYFFKAKELSSSCVFLFLLDLFLGIQSWG
jgi:hypothetical protein